MSLNYLRALSYLNSALRSAYWDKAKMESYQNKRLRNLVKYAFDNVPFYHDRFREIGILPNDIASIKDLNKLPIVRKDDIRKNYESLVSRQFSPSQLKRLHTSGSTGKPLCVLLSSAEDEFRKAKHLRTVISCGQKPRDKWVLITSPRHFGVSTRLQRFINFFVPIPVSVFEDVERQVAIVGGLRPDVLDGYSSSISVLAKEVCKKDVKSITPRFVLGGAELIDSVSRKEVENVFKVPFYDHYSCIEFDSISWQCKEKAGYHIDVDSLLLQIVKQDEEVAAGETGEIVCTSLFNYAMPFIRYAMDDLGVRSEEQCPCGRTLPLMKMMEGRKDSILALPDGRYMSPRTFAVAVSMFEYYEQFDQFRIVQKKLDLFRIYVKLKEGVNNSDFIAAALSSYLSKIIGKGSNLLRFEVEFVDKIPVDKTGKLMIVASELSEKALSRIDCSNVAR